MCGIMNGIEVFLSSRSISDGNRRQNNADPYATEEGEMIFLKAHKRRSGKYGKKNDNC